MRKTIRHLILILTVLTMVAAFGACSKKKKGDGSAESSAVTDSDINAGTADSDSGHAMGLQTVHFAYDSAVLDSGSKSTLDENASILKEHKGLKVQIEGHCDERGGIQYNVALGERRANAARSYLKHKGIAADRVAIVSYGKEKPIDGGHDEAAWAKNRRGNFRITEK